MIALDDNARRTITNARALLDAMLAGEWQQVCVRSAEGDYFLARAAGVPNPLLAPGSVADLAVPASEAAVTQACAVTAPHVGTVAWLLPVGSQVREGDAVARLAVLDILVDVSAPAVGVVASHAASCDELAEFGTILLSVAG